METKLEKMRAEVKKSMQLAAIGVFWIFILIGMIGTKTIPSNLAANEAEFMMGFQAGLLVVLDLVLIYKVGIYWRALKDDKKLKQLYYKENDERECYIDQMAGKKSMNITVVLLVVLAVIAANFSFEAFIAIIVATLVVGAVNIGIKLYYTHTSTGIEE